MPSRKLSQPGSNRSDRRREPKEHRQFLDVFEDEPATDIPNGALAKAINAIAKGNKGVPRNGSTIWSTTRPPAMEGRTGFSAHTEGEYIVSDSGAIFSQADVSHLWAWPDGTYDEIVEYVSPLRVRRRTDPFGNDDAQSGSGCFIQGRPNMWKWHKSRRRWVVQLGEELYICNYRMTQWTQVVLDSYWKLANSESDWREDGEYGLVANSRFVFRVFIDSSPPVAYPLNMPNIRTGITSNDEDGEKASRYNYLVAVARLDGTDNFRHRLQDPPTRIFTESGTTVIDENRKDWSVIHTEQRISSGEDRYGVWEGGAGLAGTPMADFNDVGDATIGLNVNNIGWTELSCDFRDCTTMYDLANVLQTTGQQYFGSFTAEWIGTGGTPRLRLTSGEVKGGDIYVREGVGGTPIAALLFLTTGTGATRSRPLLGMPEILRGLRLPTVPWVNSTLYQRWPTHYIIYRTPDYGPEGYHLDTLGERAANSPDQFIWNKDLRVCGTFIARRNNGYIEVMTGEFGEFEKADEGSVVEFEDASRVECAYGGFVNSKLMRYIPLSGEEYYYDNTEWMAACIGNARVCRVTQTGDIVTVVLGSSTASFGALSGADERKCGWWPNGYRSFIRQQLSATQWQVWDSIDRPIQTAFAIDPSYRSYCDIVDDEDLFPRASGWTCRNRFMREVRHSNVVSMQEGYAFFGGRGQKEARYCQLGPYYRQFLGYHNRDHQVIQLEDRLLTFADFTGRVSALCQASIHTAPTTSSTTITIPETYQQIEQLPGAEKRADFGMLDHGSLRKIGKDLVRFVTNGFEVVDFDGWDYQPDQTVGQAGASILGRWKRALERAHPFFVSIYTRATSYIVWWIRDRRLD